MSSKLRQALKMARRFVYASAQTTGRDLIANDRCGKPYILTPQYALEKIDDALAWPLRNCDVGTAEEQKQRFDVFCSRVNCDNCPLAEEGLWANCAIRWSQMPYEEVK